MNIPESQIEEFLPPLNTPKKRGLPKGTKLTAKQKAFAKEYVKTRNGTQSALKVYDTDKPLTANSIASENLTKPIVRQEIARLLQSNSIEISEILTIHKRNMVQDTHLPTSQKAVGDFYDILGMRNAEKPSNEVKIAFVIEKD